MCVLYCGVGVVSIRCRLLSPCSTVNFRQDDYSDTDKHTHTHNPPLYINLDKQPEKKEKLYSGGKAYCVLEKDIISNLC